MAHLGNEVTLGGRPILQEQMLHPRGPGEPGLGGTDERLPGHALTGRYTCKAAPKEPCSRVVTDPHCDLRRIRSAHA